MVDPRATQHEQLATLVGADLGSKARVSPERAPVAVMSAVFLSGAGVVRGADLSGADIDARWPIDCGNVLRVNGVDVFPLSTSSSTAASQVALSAEPKPRTACARPGPSSNAPGRPRSSVEAMPPGTVGVSVGISAALGPGVSGSRCRFVPSRRLSCRLESDRTAVAAPPKAQFGARG